MPTIGRRELLLLLIGLDSNTSSQGLGGITRIQKLLYLLDAEENIKPSQDGFSFEAYKAGPYSPRIYDDLEFLENLNFIRRDTTSSSAPSASGFDELSIGKFDVTAEASESEKAEVNLSFEQLMGPDDVMAPTPDEIAPTADSYEESRFCLTEQGKKKVEELLAKPEYKPCVDGIRRVKSRFSKYSLNNLLYYVYSRHPEMTTESEIKEKVLRRRPT
jgi:uncharacterized phage-associated protein